MARLLYPLLLAVIVSGCAPSRQAARPPAVPTTTYASTYKPLSSRTTVIRNATILTAAGPVIQNGSLLFDDGKVVSVGTTVDVPAGAQVIDARGRWVTPGVIDTHSHLGVYPAPGIEAQQDGNERTDPVTAQVWAEHSVWPQDPQFALALAGGVTAMQILPGSANLIGGRSVTVKNVPARTVQGMKFPGAAERVFIRGVAMPMDTRQTDLLRRYRRLDGDGAPPAYRK